MAMEPTTRYRAAVSLTFLVHGMVVGNWLSRIPAVRDRLHLEPAALGLCLLGAAVGALIFMPLSARLCSTFGSRAITRTMSLAFCASLPLPALAPVPPLLFAALVIYGAAAGGMDVSMNTQGAEVEHMRGKPTMSSFHALFSIGGMLGSAMGALAARLRIPVLPHLTVAAVVLALAVAVAGFWLAPGREKPHDAPFRANALRGALLGLSVIAFCILLGEGAMADWSAVYIADTGTSVAVAALGYGVFSLMMAVGRLAGDSLTARFGPVRVVRYGSLLASVGLAAALIEGGAIAAMIGFACAGAGFASIFPNMCSAAAAQPRIRPEAAIAAVSVTGYFGFLIGPPVIGALANLAGLRFGLILVVFLSLTASWLASAARTPGYKGRMGAA